MSMLAYLRQTQVLASTPRAERCCHALSGRDPHAEIVQRGPRFAWAGLARCESSWCCPLCTKLAAREQADRVARTLDNLREASYSVQFVTLTCRHTSRDALAWLIGAMTKARRRMFASQQWRRYARSFEFSGTVRAWEITQGNSGWHAHTHEFLAFKQVPFGLVDLYPGAWHDACHAEGMYASKSFGTQVDPVFSQSAFQAARYACSWGPGDELAGAPFKTAKAGNRTVWDLQRLALHGSDEAANLWHEFATGTAGRKRLSWSGKLKSLIAPPLDPPAPTGEPVVATDLDAEAWAFLRSSGDDLRVIDYLDQGNMRMAVALCAKARNRHRT